MKKPTRFEAISTIIAGIILLLLGLVILSSCKKDSDGWKNWKVEEGENKCTEYYLPARPTNGSKYHNFEFQVTPSWLNLEGIKGWSKVRGFSEGNHLKNSSARGMTRCDNGIIKWALGVHNGTTPDDEPIIAYMCELEMWGMYYCRIAREGDMYVMRMNNLEVGLPAGKERIQGYYLRPYAAGDGVPKGNWELSIKDHF